MIWQLAMWKGKDERVRKLQASLLEDSVASYIKEERNGSVVCRGIWGLLLSLFMELKVEPRTSCMEGKHSTIKLAFRSFLV